VGFGGLSGNRNKYDDDDDDDDDVSGPDAVTSLGFQASAVMNYHNTTGTQFSFR